MYKIAIKAAPIAECMMCGSSFQPANMTAHASVVCCPADVCQAQRRANYLQLQRDTYNPTPEESELWRVRSRARYHRMIQERPDELRAQQRKQRERIKADPTWLARYHKTRKAWRKRMAADPNYRLRLNAKRRAYYERKKADPVRYAAILRHQAKRTIKRREPEIRAQEKETLRQWRIDNPEKLAAQLERQRIKRNRGIGTSSLAAPLTDYERTFIPQWTSKRTRKTPMPVETSKEYVQELRRYIRLQDPLKQAAASERAKQQRLRKKALNLSRSNSPDTETYSI